ncbi:hypothetical protein BS78_05G171500 [Paspalum vaginatum]|nr:hypothetical protein BS78_05G171500 [Paspalum vaginatum]
MAEITIVVQRRDPELIRPAAPTPRETKRLSDFDDHDSIRSLVSYLFFYRGGGARPDGDDPAPVIRRALGEALVPYYPLAGRLREVEERKLVVDCTGEGALFVEARAGVRLVELEAVASGGMLWPPFPWKHELLLPDVGGSSSGILNCPLLLIQVTRLLCGGLALGLRFNHTLCDATGISQFMSAVGELARGLPAPTVAPVWCRHLLEARSPPAPAFPHHEYDALPLAPAPPAPPAAGDSEVRRRTFTFSGADIAALKRGLPPRLRGEATTFEVLAAAIWLARTAALGGAVPDGDDVRLAVIANFRGVPGLGIPAGYYGNACLAVMAVTTAGALRAGSVGDAVDLVREAKALVTAEYVRSAADTLVLRGRPHITLHNLFVVNDLRYMGYHSVDLGWGKPVYGGPVETPLIGSFVAGAKNGQGEDALMVALALPHMVMDRFTAQVKMLVKND